MRRAEDKTGKEYPGAEGAGIHPAGRGWQRGGQECLSSVWVRGWGGVLHSGRRPGCSAARMGGGVCSSGSYSVVGAVLGIGSQKRTKQKSLSS